MTSAVQNKLIRLVSDTGCLSSVAVSTMFNKLTAAYFNISVKSRAYYVVRKNASSNTSTQPVPLLIVMQ